MVQTFSVLACIIFVASLLQVDYRHYAAQYVTEVARSRASKWIQVSEVEVTNKNNGMNLLKMNSIYFNDGAYVNVKYNRNIFFTVKTTARNYQERLSVLMLTWFQTVHKDDVSNSMLVSIL